MFSEEELNAVLPEGLPNGMLAEFQDSMRHALLVRQSFLDLRDNFRRVVDPPLQSTNGILFICYCHVKLFLYNWLEIFLS